MKRAPRSNVGLCKHLLGLVLLCGLPGWARAAELNVPVVVEAGQAFSIPLKDAASGQATLYLVGPDHVAKL
jgi:hypothetical protein